MSKIEEFKLFVRENPTLIKYVKEGKATWQSFYELYDIYGSDNKVWDDYLNEESNKENKKSSFSSLNDIVNLAKKMDVNKVQEGITSLQKAISLFSDLFIKSTNDNQGSGYTPRPIYRSFED